MSTTADRVALEIGGASWGEWDDLEVHLGLDSHPSVGFSAPFDVARADMRRTFRPCSFTPLTVSLNSEPLFGGVLVGVSPRSTAETVTVQCSGYSRAAVLEDVNLPADQQPFEARGLTLRQIAERLAGIYGVAVNYQAAEGSAFSKVNSKRYRSKVDTKVDQDTKVDDFLVELAKQRGAVRTSDAKGDLLIWQSVQAGNPVARLREGEPGIVEVVATFDPQSYYSEITGYTTAKRGVTGSAYTQRNARLSGAILRSMSFRLDDVEKGDAPAAVAAKVARMFANAVTYVVNLPTWRDPSGNLWRPNTTLTLHAPRAMVYSETELLVRDVYLRQSENQQTASLGLVLPGAFSAQIPDRMPWDEAP